MRIRQKGISATEYNHCVLATFLSLALSKSSTAEKTAKGQSDTALSQPALRKLPRHTEYIMKL